MSLVPPVTPSPVIPTTATGTTAASTTSATSTAASTRTTTSSTVTSTSSFPSSTSTASSSSSSTTSLTTASSITLSSTSSVSNPAIIPTVPPIVTQTSITGGLVTSTSLTTITPTLQPTHTPVPSGTTKDFFNDKAQVAGVFAIVGLLGLLVVVSLIASVVRRYRAKKLDEDTEKVAAEAATASSPILLHDRYDADGRGHSKGSHGGYGARSLGYDSGGYDGQGYPIAGHYPDVSGNGTYAQPPSSTGHAHETYNVRERGRGVLRPGELYRQFDAPATGGAAGVGVASVRTMSAFANGFTEGAAPYAAFAGPDYHYQRRQQQPRQEYEDYGRQGFTGARAAGRDLLVAAGLQPGMSLDHNGYPQQPQIQPQPDLSRKMSQAGGSRENDYSVGRMSRSGGLPTHGSPPSPPQQSPRAQPAPQRPPIQGYALEDPYGGYEEVDNVEVERLRVLKVANE